MQRRVGRGRSKIGSVSDNALIPGERQLWKEIILTRLRGMLWGVITSDGNTFVDNEYTSSGSLRGVYGLR